MKVSFAQSWCDLDGTICDIFWNMERREVFELNEADSTESLNNHPGRQVWRGMVYNQNCAMPRRFQSFRVELLTPQLAAKRFSSTCLCDNPYNQIARNGPFNSFNVDRRPCLGCHYFRWRPYIRSLLEARSLLAFSSPLANPSTQRTTSHTKRHLIIQHHHV